jgi:hypothetical protein
MKYEEIIPSILNGHNLFEEKKGIKTLRIEEWKRLGDIALLRGYKSDNTITLFLAFKKSKHYNDSWDKWCVSEPQAQFLSIDFAKFYNLIQNENEKNRRLV